MSISPFLKKYLEEKKIPYQWMHHPEAFETSKIAAQQHVPGQQMVKSVLVKADEQYVLCVLQVMYEVDLDKLKKFLKVKAASLALESEVAHAFLDFEIGAEPPLGNLHGIPVICDKHLEDNEDIVFNAGTHTDMIRIKFADFLRVTKPLMGAFTHPL